MVSSASSSGFTNEPIAIVGIGCKFPGGSDSPSKLWDLLKAPRNVAKEIPQDRLSVERFYHPDGAHHGTFNVRETYFLDQDIRKFDNGFFGIPPVGELGSIVR
jgi:hybrid polyketide synthase / nonribosomal peptide synthetase ACE1